MEEYLKVCSWCGKLMEFRPTILCSHGICPACQSKMMEEIKQIKKAEEKNS